MPTAAYKCHIRKNHSKSAASFRMVFNILNSIGWYRKYSQNTTNKVVVYLLLRQHVSALALGHHHVSNCASEETIQCSIRNEILLVA